MSDLTITVECGGFSNVFTIAAELLAEDRQPELAEKLRVASDGIPGLVRFLCRKAGLRPKCDVEQAAIAALSDALERGADQTELDQLEPALFVAAGA